MTQSTEDDPYRASALVVFKHNSDMRDLCLKIQSEYGRWLVTSIFFMHGSAIAGLLFKNGASKLPYIDALCWFVAGLVLALATGFATWINFTLNANQYDKRADYRMLRDSQHWPKGSDPWIDRMMFAAITLGILSVACLIAGAGHVWLAYPR